MKPLLFLIFLLAFNTLACEQEKSQVFLGEVTGHIDRVPFSQVKAIVTDYEIISKEEVESVIFDGSSVLANLSVLRYRGQFILKEDIKKVILLGE